MHGPYSARAYSMHLHLHRLVDFEQFMQKSYKAAVHLYLIRLQRRKTAVIFEVLSSAEMLREYRAYGFVIHDCSDFNFNQPIPIQSIVG